MLPVHVGPTYRTNVGAYPPTFESCWRQDLLSCARKTDTNGWSANGQFMSSGIAYIGSALWPNVYWRLKILFYVHGIGSVTPGKLCHIRKPGIPTSIWNTITVLKLVLTIIFFNIVQEKQFPTSRILKPSR